MREGHFGFLEGFSLILIVIVSKIFFTSPLVLIKETGTSAWFATLISCSVSLAFFALLYFLMKRFQGQDLFQIFESVLGKFLGRGLTLLFSMYFLYYAAINIREFTAILKAYTLPYTPISMIIIPLLVVTMAMTYVGLEGIARVAYIFAYPIFGGLILIVLLAYPVYDWEYLQPWFGYGLRTTLVTGLLRSSAYDEIIILAIIINSIHGLKNFRRIGISVLITCGIIFSFCLACILAAFQFTSAGEHLSGMFQLSRVIYYSRFIQRIEAIFLFLWVFASVITVSTAFYIAIKAYCQTFQITNHRPLLFPFLFMAAAITFFPNNLSEILQIHVLLVRQYSFVLVYTIPPCILALALIRKRKGGKIGDKRC